MGLLELRRQCGVSPEARRGSQGASRAAPEKSGLHARGEGQRVMALESREGTRASRRVEEGLSRSFSGGGGKPSCPSPSTGDLRELPRVPLRGESTIYTLFHMSIKFIKINSMPPPFTQN